MESGRCRRSGGNGKAFTRNLTHLQSRLPSLSLHRPTRSSFFPSRFVASFTTDTIHRYNLNTGEFIDFFGNEDELDCPEGIEFNGRGELLVVSFLGDELVQYTEDGVWMSAVGSEQLKGPEDLTILQNGDVLVTSHYGNEIVRFQDDGGGGCVYVVVV